ncbi:PAS domain S-box protein [Massilia sp. CFBP9012]|uniref:PAS domain S-box protein n=1 Tax=Massilia sp. CFBP9012 TaxID=3096531 RepID=UPI002A6B4EAF|nr:PAS domain S-box protein [Massilia sp. CFBP9012]MDY0977252.1 PAS domain S-box protein [Massilia sp. CFBP9012]
MLDASQARFRAVFEIASVGIALTTPDGRWISVNRALCELLGHTADELQGRGFADVTHEDDRAGDAAQTDRLARGEIDFLRRQKRYLRHEYDVAVI